MLNMLIELFEIARTFFFLGIIPAGITFMWIWGLCIEEEFDKLKSFFFSMLAAIFAYLLACIAIFIIVAILTALAGVAIIVGTLIVLLIVFTL